MIRFMLTIIIALMCILLIGAYLGPDDLARCESAPSSRPGCHKADVIVAVSGGDTYARTQKAIDLYQTGWADYLIFSGAAADKTGPSNAESMRRYALLHGVPSQAIITEEVSETTHENATRTDNVFQRHNFRRVILVTSAYHQRRASIEFRRAVGGNITIVNSPVKHDKQWSQWWWLTPGGWWLAGSELTKILLVYVGTSR